ELPVELSGDVALEAAADFSVGLAFGASTLEVGTGGGVVAHAVQSNDVQSAVELAVAAAVEAVTGGESGAGGDGRDAGEAGERGFVAAAAGVGPGAQDGGRDDRADTELVEQVGSPVLDDGEDGLFVGSGFGVHGL